MKSHPLRSALFLLLAFIIVLLSMNTYQYFRLKSNVLEGVLSKIGALELAELRTYITGFEDTLKLMRDLGNDINLADIEISELNKRFFPFLTNQKAIEAFIIANSEGNEYFLTRKDKLFVTRWLSANSNTLTYKQWQEDHKPLKSWEETKAYSPFKRPWFTEAQKSNTISWTGVYRFFYSNKNGVTASLIDHDNNQQKPRNIFAIDLSLEGAQNILTKIRPQQSSLLFLVNDKGNYLASGTPINSDGQSAITQTNIDTLLTKSSRLWLEDGKPVNTPLRIHNNNLKWIVTYQMVSQNNQPFWLGLALPEREVENVLNDSLFRFDLMELAIALLGVLLTFFLMWKFNFFQHLSEKKSSSIDRFNHYIAKGEGPGIEFKSTVRTHVKSGKQGKEIEFAWLKAIVAFLNSQGGVLLLGVNDQGNVLGLETDGFENKDKCLLHIKNLVNHHVGVEFSDYISPSPVEIASNMVVMIECLNTTTPVFLKIGKNEEFYIRSGPSSVKLTPSQMVGYLDKKKN